MHREDEDSAQPTAIRAKGSRVIEWRNRKDSDSWLLGPSFHLHK